MSPTLLAVVQAAIVVAIGIVAVTAGGGLVTAVFKAVDKRPKQRPTPRLVTQPPPPDDEAPGVVAAGALLRGGAWIGRLERLAIYVTLLAHYPEGLAVALAVKSLARYPELKATSSGAAERFIIGTFVSVLVAAGAAGLALWLTGLLA